MNPRLTEEERRIRHRDQQREWREKPEYKQWRKEYDARPEVRARRSQYQRRYNAKRRPHRVGSWWDDRKLAQILSLERFWEGAQYEFPFSFGGPYGELPPQHTSDLLNGHQTFFVSNGNGQSNGLAACYDALDLSIQKALKEKRATERALAETKEQFQRALRQTESGQYTREIEALPPPPSQMSWPQAEPPSGNVIWAMLLCPVCATIFWMPKPILRRFQSTGERFTCPRGDVLYL